MTFLKSNLDRAVARFGDEIVIIRESGDISTKGRISLNRRFGQPWNAENLRQGIFSSMSTLIGGDILYHTIKDEYYFVYIKGTETLSNSSIAQQITLLKINNTCSIYRLSGTAGSMGGTKQSFTKQKEDIKIHLRAITGDLRVERPALSQTANYLMYLQNTEDIRILDRIVIDEKNYQCEVINENTYNGLYEVELSLDKR